MMSNVIRAIDASYGSIEHPDWSFVPKRIKEGLYDDLVKKLEDVCSIQETTDQNDDCSRCLFITSGTESLTLRLSLVGKFACVHDASGRFFSAFDLLSCAMGEGLSRLLKSSGVEVIDEKSLRTETTFGGEKRALYDVLFSSDGLIS
jgi:hypothetical protein